VFKRIVVFRLVHARHSGRVRGSAHDEHTQYLGTQEMRDCSFCLHSLMGNEDFMGAVHPVSPSSFSSERAEPLDALCPCLWLYECILKAHSPLK